ncbi:hypothetical protein ACFOWM_02865 [Ferruginibacter yonginensis]|uniref:DUF4476 domain-containing protein n=1 Tax=Ferruginibacter yonginensis TaxID=1310416 RepID=A0ABV8QQX9_9BACT
MNKKLFLLTAAYFLVLSTAFSQSANKVKAPNEDHDRLYNMITKSQNVLVSDSMTNALKLYAASRGYNQSLVLKQTIFLKVIYNPALSNEDRIMMCNFCLNLFKDQDEYLPRTIFTKMISALQTTK